MSDITLPGVSALSAPGVYVAVNFRAGVSGAPTQVYSAIILANCASDGYQANCTPGTVFGPNTLIPCQTSADASYLFGPGSPAYLGFVAFKAINPNTPLYVAPVAAATGTLASQTITITTAANQTTGVIQYSVDGKIPSQAVFGATDTATTIAANLAAAINGNVNLPVIATASAGVLTVTAKVIGLRGNDLRGFAQVVAGIGVAASVVSPANFTSGAGSDSAGYVATLAGLAANGQRYYYYIPEAGCDANDGTTNGICAEIMAQIDSMALPSVGIRQRAVFGSNDTMAHTTAVTTSLNDPRLEVVQCNQLDLTPMELAAQWAACIAVFETVPLGARGVNFDGFGSDPISQPYWNVSAPLNGSAPSATDIQTAIISGVSPLRVLPGGRTAVVKRVTTCYYSLGGVGNSQEVLDLRITDAGKVTICDRFFDDLSALVALRYPRMLIGQDPVAGSPPPAPGVVTPSKVKNTCVEVIQEYAAAGLIQGAQTLAGLVVQNNVQNSSSIGIIVPLFTANLAHQFLIQGNQLNAVVV